MHWYDEVIDVFPWQLKVFTGVSNEPVHPPTNSSLDLDNINNTLLIH